MSSRDLTLAVWAALALLAVLLALVSLVRPHLVSTPRSFLAVIARNPFGRFLLPLGWMWLGWHLFAR